MKAIVSVLVGGMLAGVGGTGSPGRVVQAQTLVAGAADRASAEQRYQIGQMERVLEGAVEHGLTVTRDRVQAQAQVPADLMVSDNAHARGFRLEGYGVFFDVVVPSFETTWTLSLRTLDQNDLGLDSALKALKAHVDAEGDVNLEQALRRLELQVGAGAITRTASAQAPGARNASGVLASTAPAVDPILADPNEAYRTEVTNALKDVMLAHSGSLGIGPAEWLTIAAKSNDDRPRLAPADTDARTRMFQLRGSDLADFLAGRITREEALQRIEVRVF
jgi:hypothetical protein